MLKQKKCLKLIVTRDQGVYTVFKDLLFMIMCIIKGCESNVEVTKYQILNEPFSSKLESHL